MKNKENKVLKFEAKPKEILSSDEIMKIFSGLIKLIQKSAEYSAGEKVKLQLNYYDKKLNETTSELNKRTCQVNELLKLNEDLIKQLTQENKGKLL